MTRPPVIAYVMARFPKVTETFVLYELLEIRRRGLRVEVFPLRAERAAVTHPEVRELAGHVHVTPFLSIPILVANLACLVRGPMRYLKALGEVILGCLGSVSQLTGALAVFPKSIFLAQEMGRLGVTHIHAHFASHPTLVALVARRVSGLPFSFTAHAYDFFREQQMLAAKVDAARFVVSISEYGRQFLLDAVGGRGASKLVTIHCGIDPRLFKPSDRRSSAAPPRIVCIASFQAKKGHRYLLEALSLLDHRGVKWESWWVGGGPLRAELEAQVESAGLAKRIRFLGELPRPEVLKRLRDADIAALASVIDAKGNRDGIPIFLMEAMACGLPVVSTRVSGIPELVESGRSGLLVDPGEATPLADALERLCTDPDLRRALGEAGRERVLSDFDLRANAARLASLFSGPPAASASTEGEE